MKTVYQIEIEHTEPLPDLTNVLEDRAYQHIHAKGSRCSEVVGKVVPVLPVKEMSDELQTR